MVTQHGEVCNFENALVCRELRHRSLELSRQIRRMGIGPEVQVSVWTGRTAVVMGLLAVLETGGAFLHG